MGWSDRQIDDFLREQAEEDEERRARADKKRDWCPTCGYSQSEHTTQEMDRCVEAFNATEMLISGAISKFLAEKKT